MTIIGNNDEGLIDMDKLKNLLKDEHLNSRSLSSNQFILDEYRNILKENLQKNKLQHFILKLKRVFYVTVYQQEQELLTQFLKDTFDPNQLAQFKNLIANFPEHFLPKRIKEAILKELNSS